MCGCRLLGRGQPWGAWGLVPGQEPRVICRRGDQVGKWLPLGPGLLGSPSGGKGVCMF